MDSQNRQHTDRPETGDLRHLTFDVDRARVEVEHRYEGKYEYENVSALKRGVYHEAARYYALLEDSLLTLDFTEAEALLIAQALRSSLFDEQTYRAIGMAIEDTLDQDGGGTRRGIDRETLMRKIDALSPGHQMAIIDAVERFWDRTDIHDTRERLRTVGLLQG